MKKVKFIYNPYSGEKSIINKVDKVIKVHQKHGYSIIPYRIELDNGLENAFEDINEGFEYVLVAGGDGTIDKAVNYMKHNNIDIPLAVLPVGTANDFAKLLGNTLEAVMPKVSLRPLPSGSSSVKARSISSNSSMVSGSFIPRLSSQSCRT